MASLAPICYLEAYNCSSHVSFQRLHLREAWACIIRSQLKLSLHGLCNCSFAYSSSLAPAIGPRSDSVHDICYIGYSRLNQVLFRKLFICRISLQYNQNTHQTQMVYRRKYIPGPSCSTSEMPIPPMHYSMLALCKKVIRPFPSLPGNTGAFETKHGIIRLMVWSLTTSDHVLDWHHQSQNRRSVELHQPLRE